MVALSTFLNSTAANQVVMALCAGALFYAVIIGRRVTSALHELYELLGALNHHTDNVEARSQELQTAESDDSQM